LEGSRFLLDWRSARHPLRDAALKLQSDVAARLKHARVHAIDRESV
jgi:hypothetical protein